MVFKVIRMATLWASNDRVSFLTISRKAFALSSEKRRWVVL